MTTPYQHAVSERIAASGSIAQFGTHSLTPDEGDTDLQANTATCARPLLGHTEDREHGQVSDIEVDDALAIAEQVDV